MGDPLCFPQLHPNSFEPFLGTAPKLCDLDRLKHTRSDLLSYLLSGSEDPVGQALEGVTLLMQRHQEAGVRDVAADLIPAVDMKC